MGKLFAEWPLSCLASFASQNFPFYATKFFDLDLQMFEFHVFFHRKSGTKFEKSLFFTDETERRLRANDREFNEQFRYAVRNVQKRFIQLYVIIIALGIRVERTWRLYSREQIINIVQWKSVETLPNHACRIVAFSPEESRQLCFALHQRRPYCIRQ